MRKPSLPGKMFGALFIQDVRNLLTEFLFTTKLEDLVLTHPFQAPAKHLGLPWERSRTGPLGVMGGAQRGLNPALILFILNPTFPKYRFFCSHGSLIQQTISSLWGTCLLNSRSS